MSKRYFAFFGFVILELLILFHLNRFDMQYNLLWFCNHAPLLFAIGFLFNNNDLIKGLINVGFFGQILWLIDFSSALLLDTFIFNITNYIFTEEINIFTLIPILAHLTSTFVAIALTFNKPVEYKSINYSGGYVILLFITSKLFTKETLNINCVYEVCIYNSLTPPIYELWWFLFAIVIVILPTFYIQKLIYEKSSKE